LILLFKLLLAPGLVALASLAGRRWGLRVGGAVAGFPVVVGPILLFFAIEQGAPFAAEATLKCLWGVLPFVAFCIAMSWSCLRLPLWASLLIGWAAFFAVSFLGLHSQAGLFACALTALAAMVLGRRLLPKVPPHKTVLAAPSRWDIPLRMGATLALLLSLTAAAKALGPLWSGALAAFPVASSILGSFAYLSNGPKGPAALFRGSLLGSYSFGTFCAVLAPALLAFSVPMAFLAALFSALAVQTGALFLMSRKN
jgi:hypothetical protein